MTSQVVGVCFYERGDHRDRDRVGRGQGEMCSRDSMDIITGRYRGARSDAWVTAQPTSELGLFSDADFAGDRAGMRSTSGVFLALYGPHSFFPLSAQSKKQTAVSHSTVEAEIIAADQALRTSGLPAIPLWTKILNRPVALELYQDNQATGRIVATVRAPALRHIQRTHSARVAWADERL